MAIDYGKFRAHPTMYAGICFRSRLEATWAAFFDRLEWPWEYEPFDLGGWSPDFVLKGRKHGVLVEVKPTTGLPDADTLSKMTKYSDGRYRLLYCGASLPIADNIVSFYTNCCGVGECNCPRPEGMWLNRMLLWNELRFDLVFGHDPYETMISGGNGKFSELEDASYMNGDIALDWWRESKNAVQWMRLR